MYKIIFLLNKAYLFKNDLFDFTLQNEIVMLET